MVFLSNSGSFGDIHRDPARLVPKKQNPGQSIDPGSLKVDASALQASLSKQRGVSGDGDRRQERAC
jgi:hypothetical protein